VINDFVGCNNRHAHPVYMADISTFEYMCLSC